MTDTPTTPNVDADPEALIRQVLDSPHRYEVILGDWDEWTKNPLSGYNALTVTARSTLSHLHGRHDDSPLPTAHCVICAAFRVAADNGSTEAHDG